MAGPDYALLDLLEPRQTDEPRDPYAFADNQNKKQEHAAPMKDTNMVIVKPVLL
jgi:hypothetical protein